MYTYTTGSRIDALALLDMKGLLDTPERPLARPGTFLLDLHTHRQIGSDGIARPVPERRS